MIILPAIDLYEGNAVRLYKGDYSLMTVYSDNPPAIAHTFAESGASWAHIVDLQGAKDGTTPNFETVASIVRESALNIEIGGGIRSKSVVEKYLNAGVKRVILGTAAITSDGFVADMVHTFGDAIAVSVDIRDGLVAVKGWTELSDRHAIPFCRDMQSIGVKTIICTDISKDGALGGTNMELYRTLSGELSINIIASGGVTGLGEISQLTKLGIYGAILGKALYTGELSLSDALKTAREAL